MTRQKYHILLFFLSIPCIFMIYKNWWSTYLTWASSAYPFLVLFAALAEIYFSKRNLVTIGMVGLAVLLIGILFKIQHWPGAQLCVVVSMICLMIIPMWSAMAARQQKTLQLIIAGWILLFGTGILLKMYNPIGGLLIVGSMVFLPVVTIALGASLWKNKQQQNGSNV